MMAYCRVVARCVTFFLPMMKHDDGAVVVAVCRRARGEAGNNYLLNQLIARKPLPQQ